MTVTVFYANESLFLGLQHMIGGSLGRLLAFLLVTYTTGTAVRSRIYQESLMLSINSHFCRIDLPDGVLQAGLHLT